MRVHLIEVRPLFCCSDLVGPGCLTLNSDKDSEVQCPKRLVMSTWRSSPFPVECRLALPDGRELSVVHKVTVSVCVGLFASIAMSMAMAVTRHDHGLELSPTWSWILTLVQVGALLAAGRGKGLGWLVGACVQICWITYAIFTSQHGFIPGCLLSFCIQGYSYLRASALSGGVPPATAATPTSDMPIDQQVLIKIKPQRRTAMTPVRHRQRSRRGVRDYRRLPRL